MTQNSCRHCTSVAACRMLLARPWRRCVQRPAWCGGGCGTAGFSNSALAESAPRSRLPELRVERSVARASMSVEAGADY